MILGMEIAMIVVGLMALVRGKMTLGKNKVVEGTPARLLGILGLLPLPLAVFLNVTMFAVLAAQGKPVDDEKYRWIGIGIEAGCVILCVIMLYAIGLRFAGPPGASQAAAAYQEDWDLEPAPRPFREGQPGDAPRPPDDRIRP